MAKGDGQAEEAAEPAGPEETLSLLEAIEQVLKTRELISEMTQRMASLERQRSKTRQQVILRELSEEEDRTRHSIHTAAHEAEKMAEFFSKTKLFINGKEVLAEDAVRRMAILGQDIKGFQHLLRNVQIDTVGNEKLAAALGIFQRAVSDCHIAWQEELAAYAMLLHGVKIPDSARDLFQSVWTNRNQTVRIYVKWSQDARKWISVNGEIADPRLIRYIEDVSILSRTQGLPDGFEAVVEATTDDQGKTTFRIKVNKPHGTDNPAAGAAGTSGNHYYTWGNSSGTADSAG